MNFVKFTEHNDHEGESWNFWLQLDGNEEQLEQLQNWLNTFDDDGETYELSMIPVSETEVNTLVKYSGGDYMDDQNKVVGKFVCPQPSEEVQNDADKSWEWLNDNFYKGDIVRLFK